MHDPRIGRFFAIDPLADKYPEYSPYHFSSNQPIHAKELEGLESSYDMNHRDPNNHLDNFDSGMLSAEWAVFDKITRFLGRDEGEAEAAEILENKRAGEPMPYFGPIMKSAHRDGMPDYSPANPKTTRYVTFGVKEYMYGNQAKQAKATSSGVKAKSQAKTNETHTGKANGAKSNKTSSQKIVSSTPSYGVYKITIDGKMETAIYTKLNERGGSYYLNKRKKEIQVANPDAKVVSIEIGKYKEKEKALQKRKSVANEGT